mgnify:CR=1 FL=1
MHEVDGNDRFSAKSLVYDGADGVVEAEAQHLLRWRGQEPQVGLALSGGGIRSAAYCLGVLQALAYRGALPNIDYLSTVSGGGDDLDFGAILGAVLPFFATFDHESPLLSGRAGTGKNAVSRVSIASCTTKRVRNSSSGYR